MRNFVVELLVAETRGWLDEKARGIEGRDPEYMSNLEDAAELLGIDALAIAKKVRADLEAESKDKKAGKKAPAAAAEAAT